MATQKDEIVLEKPKRTYKRKPFKITVELATGEKYKSAGSTQYEAMESLGLDYTDIKTKGTISMDAGGAKSSRFFPVRALRRVMASKLRRAQVARDLMYLAK